MPENKEKAFDAAMLNIYHRAYDEALRSVINICEIDWPHYEQDRPLTPKTRGRIPLGLLNDSNELCFISPMTAPVDTPVDILEASKFPLGGFFLSPAEE